MKLLFAGTASGHPVTHRRCTAIVAEQGGNAVLLDAGEGVTSALLDHDQILERLASIWISHTHADHISGLPMLLQGMHLAGRTKPLELCVPPGRERWFRHWLDGMYMFEEKWSFPLMICAHAKSTYALAAESGSRDSVSSAMSSNAWSPAFTIEAQPNPHLRKVEDLAESHHMRADAFSFILHAPGGRVVISSDITGMEDIAAASENAMLLVIDCAHVDVEEIHELAERQPRLRIICTHIPPELEPRLPGLQERSAADFGGRIQYAYDGMEYTIENDI